MDKTALAVFGEHLGDVTPDEHDAYWKEEARIIETLIDRCNLELVELKTEYKTFVNVVRTYYTCGIALLAIATYKKLQPDASEKEKRVMYFAAWRADWIVASYTVINDICDEKERRAGQPTLPVQLGPNNALCLFITVNNIIEDLATDIFDEHTCLPQFLTICRKNVNMLSLAMMVDNSCEKYERRRDTKWYNVREYGSVTKPAFVVPAELAFSLAGVSMESEAGKASMRLSNLVGSFARSLDDFCDLEPDTRAGSLNWAFWSAWQKSNVQQRNILLECMDSDKNSSDVLLKLYGDLHVTKQFENYTSQTLKSLEKLLEECPEETPKKTWASMLNFYLKIYSGGAGSTFQEQ